MRMRAIALFPALLLAACARAVAPAITATPVPQPSATPPPSTTQPPPASVTASPLPASPTLPVATPHPALVAGWEQIEEALAGGLLRFLPADQVLCEWEPLGDVDGEFYLWARCEGIAPVGEDHPVYPSASMPAVVRLAPDGAVLGVQVPGAGSHYASDIREMFPPEAQERVFEDLIDYRSLSEHLDWRREHPGEPPLIVARATGTP